MNEQIIPRVVHGNGYYVVPSGYDIMHHGKEGQRWGVRNGPPYPLNSKGLKSFFKNKKKKRADIKAAKEAAANKKREEIETKKTERIQKEKTKFLRTATPMEALSYKANLDNRDLEYIANRLRLENDISRYHKPEPTGLDKIFKASERVNTAAKIAQNFYNMYDKVAIFYNSYNENKYGKGNYERLPVIGGGGKKKGGNK